MRIKMDGGMLIATFMGGAFLLLGVFFIGGGLMTRNEANDLTTVPLATRGLIRDSQPGTRVFVSGTISERNPLIYEQFVNYMQEHREYDSDDGQYEWYTDETVTPPFKLATETGILQIEVPNTPGSYGLSNPPAEVYPSEDIRYSGFVHNDTVVVLGVVQEGLEGNLLDAETVHGGTRESYIDSLNSSVWVLILLGSIFGVIGLILLIFPASAFVRALRRV